MIPFRYPLAGLICLFATSSLEAADVTVTFTGLTSAQGTVRAALHDGAEGFPRERKMVMGKFAPVAAKTVTLVFNDVAPGRYAISAFHDENNDEDLSTNLLGLPSEPFGFSNNARGSFGPPSFDDAAFEVKGNDLSLNISFEQ